jgi:hypothetical protein
MEFRLCEVTYFQRRNVEEEWNRHVLYNFIASSLTIELLMSI